jgi:FkbH-like protein
MKIALLSNVNVAPLALRLKKTFEVFVPDGFDAWSGELLNEASGFYGFAPDDAVLIFDAESEIDAGWIVSGVNRLLALLPACRVCVGVLERRGMPIASLKDVGGRIPLRERITELFAGKNVYELPLEDIVRRYGYETVCSSKMRYLASSPFSAGGEKAVALHITRMIRAHCRPRKKCLVLDLDNTLWGGTVGEAGELSLAPNGEGARYYDFQRAVKQIADTGVLLAINSKNNEEDALRGFSQPAMVLKWSDFAVKKVNWQSKARNIEEIAKELNIGSDSLVFVDDNPHEREEVRIAHPETAVPEFPADTCALEQFGRDLYYEYFLIPDLTDEDARRNALYRDNALREESKSKFASFDEYLADLKIELSVREAEDGEIPRAAQMTQKINQFNLTTRRYGEADIRRMCAEKAHRVLIGRVRDRFGDSGECVLIILKIDRSLAEIDTFLMSCRAMGRNIEYTALRCAEQSARDGGADLMRGVYKATAKNAPCAGFYESAGYKPVGDADGVVYERTLTETGAGAARGRRAEADRE